MKKWVPPPSPPRWADRFLVWYCSAYFLEEIQGDLYEQFEYDCETRGVRYARLAFIIQVFRFFRPFRIKSLQEIPHPFIHPIMFRNYFKITWRNLMRHKVYSLLNILGLAIGMAACLLILRFVSFEMSYDAFHETQDRLFRLNTRGFQNGELQGTNIHTGYAFGPLMLQEAPEVEAFSRAHPWYGGQLYWYWALPFSRLVTELFELREQILRMRFDMSNKVGAGLQIPLSPGFCSIVRRPRSDVVRRP